MREALDLIREIAETVQLGYADGDDPENAERIADWLARAAAARGWAEEPVAGWLDGIVDATEASPQPGPGTVDSHNALVDHARAFVAQHPDLFGPPPLPDPVPPKPPAIY